LSSCKEQTITKTREMDMAENQIDIYFLDNFATVNLCSGAEAASDSSDCCGQTASAHKKIQFTSIKNYHLHLLWQIWSCQ
jgi:hypothetical protein